MPWPVAALVAAGGAAGVLLIVGTDSQHNDAPPFLRGAQVLLTPVDVPAEFHATAMVKPGSVMVHPAHRNLLCDAHRV